MKTDRCVKNNFFPDTLNAIVYVHQPKLGLFYCLVTYSDNRCLEAVWPACCSLAEHFKSMLSNCGSQQSWHSSGVQPLDATAWHCDLQVRWTACIAFLGYASMSHRLDMSDRTTIQISFYGTMSRFALFISEVSLGAQGLCVWKVWSAGKCKI